MKIKYLYLAIFVLFIFIIYSQQMTIKNLQSDLGNSYLVTVRSTINTLDTLDEKTLVNGAAHDDLMRVSHSLLYQSESLNRLPQHYFTAVAERLRDVASEMEQIPQDAAHIRKNLNSIYHSLNFINTTISDNPIDWYKEINNSESRIIQEAGELLE